LLTKTGEVRGKIAVCSEIHTKRGSRRKNRNATIIEDINVRRSNIHFNLQTLKLYTRISDSDNDEGRGVRIIYDRSYKIKRSVTEAVVAVIKSTICRYQSDRSAPSRKLIHFVFNL